MAFLTPRLEGREGERNSVFRAVFEAVSAYSSTNTSSDSLNLAVMAMECLVRLGEGLYAYLRPYMHHGLADLTLNAINSTEPQIALQGIEFWSTVCEVESEMLADEGHEHDQLNNFARDSAGTVVPLLLTRMASQGHDDDEEGVDDEWTPAMAAATCLSLYAGCVRDGLLSLGPLLKFIEQNLSSTDWHFREAAVMAFGCVLEGPRRELLQPLALATFPALFRLLHDPSVSVRDTNMWALGRVCELHPTFIPLEHTEQLAASLAGGLRQAPRIATSASWAIMHLFLRIVGEDSQGSRELAARILPQLTQLLLEAAGRNDADEAGLRAAAYEALTECLNAAPEEALTAAWLCGLLDYILGGLEASVRGVVEALAVEDQVRCSEIQSSCLALVGVLVRQSRPLDAPLNWNRLGAAMMGVAQAGAQGRTAVTSLEDLFGLLGVIMDEMSEWRGGEVRKAGEGESILIFFIIFLLYLLINLLSSLSSHYIISILLTQF